jgi:hypothetical protein
LRIFQTPLPFCSFILWESLTFLISLDFLEDEKESRNKGMTKKKRVSKTEMKVFYQLENPQTINGFSPRPPLGSYE